MVLYSNYIVLEHGIFEGFLELENGKIKGLYEKWQVLPVIAQYTLYDQDCGDNGK